MTTIIEMPPNPTSSTDPVVVGGGLRRPPLVLSFGSGLAAAEADAA
jgi:hypothetical protein